MLIFLSSDSSSCWRGVSPGSHRISLLLKSCWRSRLCVVLAFALASSRELRYWRNEVTLFTQARNVAARPDALIENGLADGLMSSGQSGEALSHYEASCELDSESPFCHYGIARILFDQNQFARAIDECHAAARLTNDQVVAVACYDKSGAVMLNWANSTGLRRNSNLPWPSIRMTRRHCICAKAFRLRQAGTR